MSTNLLYSNPAFAGTNICPRLYLAYRNKYLSLGSAYQTFYGSYDQYFDPIRGDFAFTLIHDNQAKGLIKNTLAGVIYAKGIPVSQKLYLKLGLELNYLLHSANNSSLAYPDQIDPFYGFVFDTQEEQINYNTHKINANAGVLLYNDIFFAGLAMYNITQPNSPNSKKNHLLKRRILVHGGIDFAIDKTTKRTITLTPIAQVQSEAKNNLIIIGTNFRYNWLMVGLWGKENFYFNAESFSLLVGFVQKKYKFAYNCDMSFTGVSRRRIDSHEVSVTYYFDCLEMKRKSKAVKCPGM